MPFPTLLLAALLALPRASGLECSVGPSWLEFVGRRLGGEPRKVAARTAGDCRRACVDEANCTAFHFAASGRDCRLTRDAEPQLEDGSDWVVGVRWCPSAVLEGERCGSAEVEPGQLLLGFAEAAIDAADLQACADACRNSQAIHQFRCRSGMFYSSGSENCILNTETKESQPELFMAASAEEEGGVAYFGLPCVPLPDPDRCGGRFRTLRGYLQGFEFASLRNVSAAECVRECVVGSLVDLAFACRSVNYNRSERFCTLSPADKDGEPAFFWGTDFTDNVLYIDLNCADES